MRTVLARVAGLFRGRRFDRELDDEVRFHIEMLTQDNVRRGMSPAEARRAALRTFGGVVQMKEEYRDQAGLPFVETAVQDLRYGLRTLLRTPGFTLAALLTLALGIGANSAIFSVINAVLLRPIPYADPERIVQLHRNTGGLWTGHTHTRFQYVRENLRAAEAVTAWRTAAFNVVSAGVSERLPALAVSHEYFRVFGGRPLHGRTFEPVEDVPSGPDLVVLKHGLWRRLFAGDPGAVGRTMTLGDRTFTIIGVMPEGFDTLAAQQFYVPLRPGPRGPGSGFNYRVAARLKPAVGVGEANAELATLFAAFATSHQDHLIRNEQPFQFLPLQETVARGIRPSLLMMSGAVGLLLLIACANTANLLLARASGRRREISVRAALGAARGRIVRQLLTESLLLFCAGGLLGVMLAYWLVPALVSITPPGYLPAAEIAVDGAILVATMALSLVTGLVFGLVPALTLSRNELVEAFKQDGARTTSSRRSTWLRNGLVVGEVGLCMVLLAGAGILVRTFVSLRSVELGFDPTNVVTARMSMMGERYGTSAAANAFFDRGLERLRQIPGVLSASVVNGVPIDTGLNLNFDQLETPEREAHLVDWRYATPEYFETIGIRLVAGRGFSERDGAGAARVTVVSEQLARRYYESRNPVGQFIQIFPEDGPIEIIGVARDVRDGGLSGPVPALMYVPAAQAGDAAIRTAHSYFEISWVVRAERITPALTQRVQEELRSIDHRQPITAVRTMDEVKAQAMRTETFQMALVGTFAVVGLALAAAGIYGLVAYSVAQRTREFGIRLALGASRSNVLLSVVRQGAVLAGVGVLVGGVAAAAAGRTLETFMGTAAALQPGTVAAVGLILVLVATVASLVPALRAVKLNPVSALRE